MGDKHWLAPGLGANSGSQQISRASEPTGRGVSVDELSRCVLSNRLLKHASFETINDLLGARSAMNESLSVFALAKSVWHDFRRDWRALVIFEVLFKLLEGWLFVPAAAVVLSAILSRAGHVAISNGDILEFFLSPLGLLYAAIFSTVAAALLLIEQAGIMVIVALTNSVEHPTIKQTPRTIFLKMLRSHPTRRTQSGAVGFDVASVRPAGGSGIQRHPVATRHLFLFERSTAGLLARGRHRFCSPASRP